MVDLVKAREKARKEKEKREAEKLSAEAAVPRGPAAQPPSEKPQAAASPPPPEKEEVITLDMEGEAELELTPAAEGVSAPQTPPEKAAPPPPPPADSAGKAAPPAASAPEEAAAQEKETRFLSFRVGDGLFGIPIECIDEIVPFQRPNEMPNVPPTVAGILSLRGRVVTVLDARVRLGFPGVPPTEESRIVVLRHEGQLYGLWVDAVGHVLPVAEERVEDAASVLSNLQQACLRGVYYHRDDMLVLLHLEKFIEVAAE
jgi:purine-binding chemotaxis protein CheW